MSQLLAPSINISYPEQDWHYAFHTSIYPVLFSKCSESLFIMSVFSCNSHTYWSLFVCLCILQAPWPTTWDSPRATHATRFQPALSTQYIHDTLLCVTHPVYYVPPTHKKNPWREMGKTRVTYPSHWAGLAENISTRCMNHVLLCLTHVEHLTCPIQKWQRMPQSS